MPYKLPVILGLTLASLLFAAPALAQYGQYGQYGGQQVSPNFRINKLVKDPQTGSFVDNLGVNDHTFAAGTEVMFRIEVTNTSNTTIKSIDVKDTLPPFLNFVSGPGTFSADTKQITFRVENLAQGAMQQFDIKAKIVASDKLPSQQAVFCVVNAVQATGPDNRTNSDTAQLCISNKVAGAIILPKTGPITTAMLGGAGIFGAGILLGFLLRKAKH